MLSSHRLDTTPHPSRSIADRLLVLLKTRGPQSAADLGRLTGTTSENVRQQLNKLRTAGLVEARPQRRGIGRPVFLWHLTEAGQKPFPDAHAELAVQLIQAVREALGPDALEALVRKRERESRENYRRELDGIADPAARVARLAQLRSREGYMAQWKQNADGSLLLIENHCPICAAARACQGLCRAELQAFRGALGPNVSVERAEHLLSGGRRCVYRVTPRSRTSRAARSSSTTR